MMRGLFVLLLACAGAARADAWQIGDLTTYHEGSWGGCTPTCGPFDGGAVLLEASFNTVYAGTGGVIVSSASGFTMVFTDAHSVLAYLPSIGTYAPLSVVNPVSTVSGAFGGEVLALEFNVYAFAQGDVLVSSCTSSRNGNVGIFSDLVTKSTALGNLDAGIVFGGSAVTNIVNLNGSDGLRGFGTINGNSVSDNGGFGIASKCPARLWQIGRPITHAAKYSLMDRVTFAPIIFQHPSSHEHLEETS
jgi:hypothetical protein